MSALDLKKLRVQDPVLTKLAYGYHNNDLVGDSLMPIVEIDKEAGKIPTFGRLAFRVPTTVRQVRGKSNRLEPEDIGSIDVALEEHDLEYAIDYREDNEASFPLRQYALSTVQDVIALGREKEIATLAQNEANYESTNKVVLSGESQFDHANSNPFKVIDDAKHAIKRSIGHKPNVCVIAGDVWEILKEHPSVIEKVKYVQKGIITPEIFAGLIDVETVKIGEAVYEDSSLLKDIWTDTVVLAYVPTSSDKKGTVYQPSYGYTVRRKDGLFVDTYVENGGKLEVVRCTDIYNPHVLGKVAGFLIKDCLKKG
ncbi:inorganic pyrophosphatase [Pasteurellaceae bacterium HPA106]|uniref:major capsid protein n=1 Tax=Spirabiliibacterium pneumoniae TaxID=221400 RepID=UPI001AACABD0|nr:inorganic pyrophosphatase [Spirabiliibacterium pneumoniae]MBE2896744.1 inorganic pyrophosphatase [Spirabiliibacterium pneumoniae]